MQEKALGILEDPWVTSQSRLRSSWQLSTFSSFVQANNSLVIHVETLYFSRRLGQEVAPPVTSCFMEGRAWPRLCFCLMGSYCSVLASSLWHLKLFFTPLERLWHGQQYSAWGRPPLPPLIHTPEVAGIAGSADLGPSELQISRQEFSAASLQLQ